MPKNVSVFGFIKKKIVCIPLTIPILLAFPLAGFSETKPAVSSKPAAQNSDERQIVLDRDAAVAAALETAKKSGPNVKSIKIWLSSDQESAKSSTWGRQVWDKLAFWKKKPNQITSQPTSPQPPPASQASKTASSRQGGFNLKSFFTSESKPENWNEVAQKRKERLDKFPNLDPAQDQESINQMKIELKRGFLSAGSHNLNDVIARAIQVHLPAQIAYERVQLSERRILKAFRDFFTTMDFTRTQKDGTLSTGPYKSRSWRIALRQPLFRGGVLWNTFQLEMAAREAAKKELDRTVSDLIAAASSAYFEYERAWNVLEDRQVLYDTIKEVKRISDEKQKANLISEIEKLNMDSLFSQVEYDVQTAKQDRELAKLELQRVLELDLNDAIDVKPLYQLDKIDVERLGIHPAELSSDNIKAPTVEVAQPQTSLAVEGKWLEHYIDLAYAFRPDLQVEAAKLRAARLSHKIAGGKVLPEADLIVEFGQLGEVFVTNGAVNNPNSLGTDKPPWKNEWKIGTELSWNASGNSLKYSFDRDEKAPSISQFLGQSGPTATTHTFQASLLDNLNSLAELKETKIAVLEQVVELEKTERDVIRQVKEAYYNYNKALIQLESNHKRLVYRERLAKLAKHRLENNEIQTSEYVQTEIDYNEERAQVHKALADFYLSKANLNKAIGIRDYLKIEPHQFESR